MDELQYFIARQNIERFIDRLEVDGDPRSRSTVRQLLVSEEDKFANLSERLDILDQNISRASMRITKQKTLIAQLISDGEDSSLAEQILNNLQDLRRLFITARSDVVTKISRGPI